MREDAVDVLVVEDNPGDVRLIEEAFAEGARETELHVVTDGTEALDFLYRRGDREDAPRPGIVLLDLNLPRRTGEEVLAELRADPELAAIPVIVLTSSEAETDVVRSYELDANAYVTKPVDPEAFLEEIRTLARFWLSTVRLPGQDG